jgi:hypothetical protein
MRILIATALAGVALVSLAACNKPAAGNSTAAAAGGAAPAAAGPMTADQMPQRKPGLWKQTMSMDGGPTNGAIQLCVDAASEAKMNITAQNIAGAKCDKPQFTHAPDGTISFTNSCDMGSNGKIQTSGTIKGDFNSGYVATIATTTSGSPMAQMNGAHTMVINATWTGPCAPGQTGGDMILPNGMTVNASKAVSAAPPAGGQ